VKYLKYNHPSAMKYSISQTYNLEELKKELSLDKIKVLFEPIDFEWTDLEPKKHNKKAEVIQDEN
jgi:hypothetical protein